MTIFRRFTLLELLIVVGIIGILAGMLLPSLNKARGSTLRTSCENNLKQIGLGLEMYLDVSGGFLPYCKVSPLKNGAGEEGLSSITDVLEPYVGKNSKIFRCPADNRNLYETDGSSYVWARELGINGKHASDKELAMAVPGKNVRLPLMYDGAAFHGKSGESSSRNYLYLSARLSRDATKETAP